MKKIIIAATLFAAAASVSSCNKLLVQQNNPVYSLTNSQVTNGALVTELNTEGGKKLTGTVSGKFTLFGRHIKGNEHRYVMDNNSHMLKLKGIEAAKRAALYKALAGSGYDILLAPIYTVETRGRNFTVSVTGIGAKIQNVQQKDIVDYKGVIHNLEPMVRARID